MTQPRWDLDEVVPYAVVRTAHLLEQDFSAVMAAEGLTVRHFGILSQFADEPVLTAAGIARALDVTPQSIGPQIDALQARGLMTRTPRRGQGRPNELRLTDEGQATLRRALRIARAEQERLVGDLSEGAQRTMLRQLRTIGERARSGPGPAPRS